MEKRKQQHTEYRTQTIVLNSRDRFSPEQNTVGDFRISLIPKDGIVQSLRLKYVSMPFAFRNVTYAYGNELQVVLYPDYNNLGVFYTVTLVVPFGYYTIQSLIGELNALLAQQLALIAYPYNIQFIPSPQLGRIAIQTNSPTLRLDFNPSAYDISKRYIYTMLGLSVMSPIVFLWNIPGTVYLNMPFFATQELPFAMIMINMDLYPDNVFTTNSVSALFTIPVHGYNALETLLSGGSHEITHGIIWKEAQQFEQFVFFDRTIQNLPTVRVRLTDDRGNSMVEHFQENDFIMMFDVEKIKTN
jgi:hypothetical protein